MNERINHLDERARAAPRAPSAVQQACMAIACMGAMAACVFRSCGPSLAALDRLSMPVLIRCAPDSSRGTAGGTRPAEEHREGAIVTADNARNSGSWC